MSSSLYVRGHAPTSLDYANGYKYADDVLEKEACLAQPDKYEWVESGVARYLCPEGITCETGKCKFKHDACLTSGELPYYDCVRRTVECDTTPSGLCEICDYTISKGHSIEGPFIPADEDAGAGCYAGDSKYNYDVPDHPEPSTTPGLTPSGFCDVDAQCAEGWSCVDKVPESVFDTQGITCTTDEECGGDRSVCSPVSGVCVADVMHEGLCVMACSANSDCGGLDPNAVCGSDPGDAALYGRCYLLGEVENPHARMCRGKDLSATPPYTVSMYNQAGEVEERGVACSSDFQCAIPPGVGGKCGMDPSKPTYGLCYDAFAKPYTEWRDEIELWEGHTSKNVCLETLPQGRRWCEMPWARAGEEGDDLTKPLGRRVKSGWKSRARPPFWYNETDGTCEMTRSYCKANLKNGGFSTGYGRNHDYWLFSDCRGDVEGEVVGDYDCCTPLGDSLGQFGLGRTISTDLKELIADGDVDGFGERWSNIMLLDDDDGYEYGEGEEEEGDGEALPPNDHYETFAGVDFLCDPRLKTGLVRVASRVFSPSAQIHGYEWVWSSRAQALYGVSGRGRGLLTTEVQAYFPSLVQTDANGYDHISFVPDALPEYQHLGRVMKAFRHPNDISAYSTSRSNWRN